MSSIRTEQLVQFRHRAVRDLAWACFGPPLITTGQLVAGDHLVDCLPSFDAARQDWLLALDAQPQPLMDHLGDPARRLGLYFERLWHFFLREDPHTELLAHNLPVRDGGRTLGEFDCLYHCHRRQQDVHLELAIKFYLYAPGHRAHCWLGPNSRDSLEQKLEHLLLRQTRLSSQPAAVSVLAERYITDPIREIALRGYLFRHPDQTAQLPAGAASDIPIGSWVAVSELGGFLPRLPADCLKLTRLRWLSPSRREEHEPTLLPDDIPAAVAAHFAEDDHPLLFAALSSEGVEQHRFFVVPDHWPEAADTVRGSKQG